VHSHQDHARRWPILSAAGVPVAVHAFTDGRDTPPQAAPSYSSRRRGDIAAVPGAPSPPSAGATFAMDRDKRWERVQRPMTRSSTRRAALPTPQAAIADAMRRGRRTSSCRRR
jgi:2,3-bisphosphoglycerate-independent phosphoglycerate mutase